MPGRPLKPKLVILYQDQKPVENYSQALLSIQPQDRVKFDQKTYQVDSIIWGETDLIASVVDVDKIIRIPKTATELEADRLLREAHVKYYPLLKQKGVQVVQVFVSESPFGQYTVVKREPVQFKLSEYLTTKNELNSADDPIDQGLIQFARSTSKVSYIEDFSPEQIIWNGQSWLLVDWGTHIFFPTPEVLIHSATVFDDWLEEPSYHQKRKIFDQLILSVLQERRSN